MKLIKEDDKLFHFKTPDGEFKVVKKGLSKVAMDKINKIKACSGGEVESFDDGGEVHPLDPGKTKDFVKGYQPSSGDQAMTQIVQHPINALSKALHLYDGTTSGDVGQTLAQNDAQYDIPPQTGEVDPINPGMPPVDRAPASVSAGDSSNDSSGGWFKNDLPNNLPDFGKAIGNYIKPGIENIKNIGRGVGAAAGAAGDVGSGVLQGAGLADDASPAPSTVAPPKQTPDSIKQQIFGDGTAPLAQAPQAGGGLEGQLNSMYGHYANDEDQMAKTQAKSAAANAEYLGKFMTDVRSAQDDSRANQAQLESENAQLAKDVANGKIDPNRFVNNMSTGNKIGTAISILFSGLGAGAQGQNMALNVLQDQVKQDIDAQKNDLGNKQNLLTQNLHRLGNMQAAIAATTAQKYAMLQGQIQQQAYQDGSQTAMQVADMNNQKIGMAMLPLHMQVAQYDTQRKVMQAVQAGQMDPMSAAVLMGGKSNPAMMKMMMDKQQQQVQSQRDLSTFKQAVADTKNPKYMFGESPDQAQLRMQQMGKIHSITKIRDPKMQHELYDASIKPTFLGNFNGNNDIRQGNVFKNDNQFISPYSAPSQDEGDE